MEEGYLVNATLNAQGQLEGKLAPSFNRCVGGDWMYGCRCPLCIPSIHPFHTHTKQHRIPPGRYINVAYVLSAPSKEALALSNFTVLAAEVC